MCCVQYVFSTSELLQLARLALAKFSPSKKAGGRMWMHVPHRLRLVGMKVGLAVGMEMGSWIALRTLKSSLDACHRPIHRQRFKFHSDESMVKA